MQGENSVLFQIWLALNVTVRICLIQTDPQGEDILFGNDFSKLINANDPTDAVRAKCP